MEHYNFKAARDNAGKRLDIFLVDSFRRKRSRSYIKKLIENNNVFLNKKNVKVHHVVLEGDEIEVSIPEPENASIKPENINFNILHEDDHIIVIDKPAGLVVHPAPGNYSGTVISGLLFHCKNLSGVGGSLRPGVVHRLDKDTSGIMVFAKSDTAHKDLAEQFKNRKIKRIYIALVKGIVQLDNGIIDLPIGRRNVDRKKMGIEFAGGKEASTQYNVLKRFRDFTMLELRLGTGRTHQIRVHTAHIGHPVLGDKLYGSGKGISRQALHAKLLGFTHPVTKKYLEFESEIPADMQEIVNRGCL